MRPLTSYAKVETIISKLIRTQPMFVTNKIRNKSKLLNIGSGPNPHPDFINLDYHWTRNTEICWNIEKKPYPLENESLEGIYTEHCVEHISFDAFKANIAEFYRMLKPGGNLRIVTPDAELYFDLYERRKNGEQVTIPHEQGYISPIARINGLFRNHGHKFIYDFETVRKLLEAQGFKNIKKENFRTGRDPRLLIDMQWRADESLYVEATK